MKLKIIHHWPLLLLLTTPHADAVDLSQLISPATIEDHREELSLTLEQIEKLKGIRERAEADFRPLEEAVRREEEVVETILRSESIAKGEAEGKFAALLEAEAAAKKVQFATFLALREVLTPEQVERAISLARRDREARLPLEARVEGKAERLKAAFDELGIKPPSSLQERGDAIMEVIRSGDLEEADRALDELSHDVGLDEAGDETVIDFSQVSPGETDPEVLKARLEAIESAAGEVTSLPILRRLVQARDALEEAKSAEDAVQAGRILTWGEQILGVSGSR
jgi:Spy/CpxP family protein refolding chaperone